MAPSMLDAEVGANSEGSRELLHMMLFLGGDAIDHLIQGGSALEDKFSYVTSKLLDLGGRVAP